VLTWLRRTLSAMRPNARVHRSARFLRGRYDSALTSDNNRRHWANADGLSANAANSPEVRRILRNRARYEVANNSYARGIVLTLANDIVGTGPRLQLLTEDAEANRQIEQAFNQWAKAVSLAEKLRTLRMAQTQDGEAFAVLISNPRLDTTVQLDLRLIEAEQITTPDLRWNDTRAIDGIVFDAAGNPTEYHVLREHPGNGKSFVKDYDRIPAEAVLHVFRVDRPGQSRGIPEITPALPLFAMLRDYSLATLDAAKAAAYYAGIIYTDAPPHGETDAVEALDPIELDRNTLLTMPGGWKMAQLHAEQPAVTHLSRFQVGIAA
jgi:capsid protein